MPKRKVTDEQLREIVRSRRTKGSAFSHSHADYVALQERVTNELAQLSRVDIFAKFPDYCYDLR